MKHMKKGSMKKIMISTLSLDRKVPEKK